MFDSITEFFRSFLWGLVSGVLEWLYSANVNLIQPSALVNWSNASLIHDIAVKLIVPISIAWIVLMSIFGILKMMTTSRERNYYDLVKGVFISSIVSGSFWYVAPFFYSEVQTLSIPLAETVSTQLSEISAKTENFKYFTDNNGSLVRLDTTTGLYYDGNNSYVLSESYTVPNAKVAIVKNNGKGVLNEIIFNSNCDELSKCTFSTWKTTLKETSAPAYDWSVSKIDTMIFETVIRAANMNNADIDAFLQAYQSAKVNHVKFDYNAKTACPTFFCNSTYFYQLNEFFTVIIGIVVLMFLVNLALQMISCSLIYTWDMLLLPYVSATLVTGNPKKFEGHVKEMMALLAVNLLTLWSFYLCMLFVQFSSTFSNSWLFGFVCLVAGLSFANRVPQKILSLFGVQVQISNLFTTATMIGGQLGARATMLGGFAALAGVGKATGSIGSGIASLLSGSDSKNVYSSSSSNGMLNSNATSFSNNSASSSMNSGTSSTGSSATGLSSGISASATGSSMTGSLGSNTSFNTNGFGAESKSAGVHSTGFDSNRAGESSPSATNRTGTDFAGVSDLNAVNNEMNFYNYDNSNSNTVTIDPEQDSLDKIFESDEGFDLDDWS